MSSVHSYLSPCSLTCSPYRCATRPLFPPQPCCAFATEPSCSCGVLMRLSAATVKLWRLRRSREHVCGSSSPPVIWPKCFVSRSGRQKPVISLCQSTAGSARALMSLSCEGRRLCSRACRRHFHDAHTARTCPLRSAVVLAVEVEGWLMSSDEYRLMVRSRTRPSVSSCRVSRLSRDIGNFPR